MIAPLLLVASLAPSADPALATRPAAPHDRHAWTSSVSGASARDEERKLDLELAREGLLVEPVLGPDAAAEHAWTFRIGTASFGRMGAAQPVVSQTPTASGARSEIAHGGLTEWFVRNEHGVEHGWTIPSAPEGDAKVPLWIGLRVEGDLSMHVVDDGSGAFLRDARGVLRLRYGFLKTYDATGAAIPSRISSSPWGLGIQVDDSKAKYPVTVDPLITSPFWFVPSDQAGAGNGTLFGSGVGDVNGDGFSDVIVSAPDFDGPAGVDEGRVRVYLGTAIGPGGSPSWSCLGGTVGGRFGAGASAIGDVNGDGYGDVAILAPGHGNGRVYVWFGGPDGLGTTPVTAASSDWSFEGPAGFGRDVQAVGDVNGDGYDDFGVASPLEDVGSQIDAGRAYVFFGSAIGPMGPAWVLNGSQAGAQGGYRVTAAGDVNADGYSDVLVTDLLWDHTGTDQGRARCFHGGPSFATDFNAEWASASSGVNGSRFGQGGHGVGDFNGDGFADVAVSGPGEDNGQPAEGRLNLYYGSLGGLPAGASAFFERNVTGAGYGSDLAFAGDVDGDGFSDFVVGVEGPNPEAWLVAGRPSLVGRAGGPGDQLLPSNQANNAYGRYVKGAGDVNGDGLSDVLISAPLHDGPSLPDQGGVFLHFGSPNSQTGAAVQLTVLGPAGAGAPASQFGRSVSSAGDVNADGFNDIVVGSPEHGPTQNGRVQVFLGSATGVNLASPYWTLDSTNTGERFGWSVSAGDVDNDGRSDILVGAPRHANGQIDEGRVYLYRSLVGSISSTSAWTYESNEAGALLGSSLSALGDVNADGFADIAVGAPGAMSAQGSVTAFHGRGTLLGSIVPDVTLTSGVPGSEFGTALALVGDVNLDGFTDLAVGAPKIDDPQADEGRVYVYLGSYQGISSTVAGSEESQNAGALLGASLAACGDINGDGRAEILVGAPGYNAATSGGAAFVYQTQPAGMGVTLNVFALRTGEQANSQFGYAVSAGGDVNGDEDNDILVGAPDWDGSLSNQGRVYLYLGSSSSIAATPSEVYDGPSANARFGESIALGGDVNGDGLSDPIGGIPSANGSGGAVQVFVAGGTTAWRVNSSQRQVADTQALQILGRTSETNQFEINLGVQNSAGNTATAMGRAEVRLEWEFDLFNAVLDGLGTQQQTLWTDTGSLGSGLRLSQAITGLVSGNAYHWRARTLVRNPYYPHTRWTTIQLNAVQEKKIGVSGDCNQNGVGDQLDIQNATSLDCNGNTIPDECDVPPIGSLEADCNANLVPDSCEYTPLFDCDGNGVLDECQMPPFGSQDCNGNFVVDACDITAPTSLDTNGDGVPDECQPAGATYCFGDGTGVSCPCGNTSPPGNQEGCASSLGFGGRLRTSGVARVSFDNFTLLGDQMPNSSALYFQGTAQQSSGNGAVFGDGKRCAAGSLIRLGTKINAGNASQYPAPGDQSVSIKGALPGAGGTRYYQCWYRNAAAFCTASTFNLTNGIAVTWIP